MLNRKVFAIMLSLAVVTTTVPVNAARIDGNIIIASQEEDEVDYVISYQLDGGVNSSENPTTYKTSDEDILLKDPTRVGYVFLGWYSDPNFSSTVFKISKGSIGNKTFYAKWIPVQYNVKFDGNGADYGNMDNQAFKFDIQESLVPNGYRRTGHVFIGWNTKRDGTGTRYGDQAIIKNLTTENGETLIFFAQWRPEANDPNAVRYEVKYELNGGVNHKDNPQTYKKAEVAPGTGNSIKLKAPSRKGYIFLDWYTDALFTYRTDGISEGTTGEITFYAKWTAIKFIVDFRGNGATKGNMSSVEVSYDSPTKIMDSAYTRDGYRFVGWNTKEDGSGDSYLPGQNIGNIISENNVHITMYAQWEKIDETDIPETEEKEYRIDYVLNGGKNSPNNPKSYKNTDGTIILEAPVRTGYVFKGWYTDNTWRNKITSIKAGSTGNKTIYARWEAAPSYDITYELNGGINSISNPTVYVEGIGVASLVAPTRENYQFAGWYFDEALTSKAKNISAQSRGNITLYAKWEINTYSVLFNANGGSGSMSALQCKVGASYRLTANKFKRKGYLYEGWNTKADGSGEEFVNKENIKNLTTINGQKITLYAVWKKVSPAKTSISSIKNSGTQKLTVKWKKISGAEGYQLQYATDSKFTKNKKTTTMTDTSFTVKKLTKNKTYYVRVRTYAIDSTGSKVYSAWSNTKKLKIKK